MQGYDSVSMDADIELGGTDQRFNLLMGRELQKHHNQAQQCVIMMPLLEGLDGVNKMSKSLGNYVGVSEPPNEIFGKLMSVSDALMARYYLLLLGEDVPGIHPMEAKKQLATRIVEHYHGSAAAQAALDDFTARFSKRDLDHADLPAFSISGLPADIVSIVVAAYAQCFQTTKSRGDARRLVEQGSVQWKDEKIADPTAKPALQSGDVLKLDKKRAVRIG